MAEAKKKPAAKAAKATTETKPKKTEKVLKATEDTLEASSAELVDEALETTEQAEVKTAKAGKRSAKALKQADDKEAKEERKVTKAATEEQPKVMQKPARSRLERRSKNYRKVAEQIEKGKNYNLKEGLDLAAKTSPVKFDASVELHIRLGVDPRQADQNIRDNIVLPAGTGKSVRVAVFADADGVAAAKKAGADIAGSEEFLQQLDKGILDFDVLIATPAQMPKLGKYARALGPKGLMPNPKSGTVTTDVAKAVTEAKAGKVEYRVDSTGIVHLGIGKVSFGTDKLLENARAVLMSIKGNKPSSIKGSYVKSVFLTTTMGPSVPVDVSETN